MNTVPLVDKVLKFSDTVAKLLAIVFNWVSLSRISKISENISDSLLILISENVSSLLETENILMFQKENPFA